MLLKLPILVHDDETSQLDNLGISVDYDSYPVEDFYFTRVDVIAPYDNNTRIILDGEEFICQLPVNEVLKLYKDAFQK